IVFTMNLFIIENKEYSRFLDEESELYKDLNYDCTLLDNSHSDVQSEFFCNSTTTNVINIISLVEDENFIFTEAISNFIKAYTNSRLLNDDNLEDNIN
ncbi:8144_t:CDS:1, partial [Scutellospora calospora]